MPVLTVHVMVLIDSFFMFYLESRGVHQKLGERGLGYGKTATTPDKQPRLA